MRWCFCIPGMPFHGKTLETASLGGSETAGLCLARELVALGESVHVFTAANIQAEMDGVMYRPIDRFNPYASTVPHDVTVVQRSPDMFCQPYQSRLNVLWQHDMTLGRHRSIFGGVLWNVDKVALLSEYMVSHYKSIHGVDDALVFLTRNGITLSEFVPYRDLPRDRFKLMYTARPERGLDVLCERIMPKLIEHDSRYTLHVAGYDNKMHSLGPLYERCQRSMEALGDRCRWLGHLTHAQLYEHYATAHLLVYPTPSPYHKVFDEISCISAMEAQASGLPMVTSRRGALPETLAPEAGVLIEGEPWTDAYVDAFVEAVIALEGDAWETASAAGRQRAKELDWSGVACQWRDMALEEVARCNDEPQRLVRHLARRGDRMTAEYVAETSDLECPPRPPVGESALPEKAVDNWLKEQTALLGCPIDGKRALWLGDSVVRAERPWELLAMAEAKVEEDGYILFAAPYGCPEAGYLWELEDVDITEMLAGKAMVDAAPAVLGVDPLNLMPRGIWLVTYRIGGEAPKLIDLRRKATCQRPRETLSVNIIVGGKRDHETLHWCLRSVEGIADEIVIGDTGMSDEARRIAGLYKTRIVSAPDALVDGFDAARNAVLDASTCDWILWIDADERLLGSASLLKYLRHNVYAGYSIRQHHFAVDTQFTPDMPVRLFRRRGWQGKPIRFYGMIHEHPEMGLNEGPGPVLVTSDIHIGHVGYLTEAIRKERFARNRPRLEADIAKYPDRILQKHFIMRDLSIEITREFNSNGKVITEAMKEKAEQIKRLYREHFLGKQKYQNIDSLPYYTQALTVLNEGVDVAFSMAASRDEEPKLNGATRARFASADEAAEELSTRIRSSVRQFEAEIW